MQNLRLDVKVGGAWLKWPNGEYADCRDILLTETIDISKKTNSETETNTFSSKRN